MIILRYVFVGLIIILGLAGPSYALTLSVAEQQVDITTNFSGQKVVVFGVKPETGMLAITLNGPEAYTIIRQKRPVLGMWMNAKSVGYKQVPFYYDYALEAEESDLASLEDLVEYKVGVNAMRYEPRSRVDELTQSTFHEALIRKKQQSGFFSYDSKQIELLEDRLFRVDFDLPADVPAGEYKINAYVFDGGEMVKAAETSLQLRQAGFGARLYTQAHEHSFLYGVLVVLFAACSGYLAHLILGRR